jgi:hypothetical protein
MLNSQVTFYVIYGVLEQGFSHRVSRKLRVPQNIVTGSEKYWNKHLAIFKHSKKLQIHLEISREFLSGNLEMLE